ncbi:MAG: GntR family transcriptional regulator [Armatimonadetes bacterium]|nr:GntR family transcriptional regulator [Armatimonadota bacterium]
MARRKLSNTLDREIYERLREAIIAGRFKPGERLVERDLAAFFKVSRTPVRRALQRLSREKLVTSVPGKGMSVTKLTPGQVGEIYELRAALEGLAAMLAATRATPEDRVALQEVVRESKKTLAEGDLEATRALNDRYHRLLGKASGNATLAEAMESMLWQLSILLLSTWTVKGRPEQIQREHEAVVEAILSGDALLARARAEEHIFNASRVALSVLEKEIAFFREGVVAEKVGG